MRGRTRLQIGACAAVAAIAATLATTSADAAGASSMLVRYPYLTDPTPTSAQVTWATTNTPAEAASSGVVTWGPAGSSCASGQAAARTSTYSAFGATYVQHTAPIGGPAGSATALSPGTAYCYRVWTGTTTPLTDLVGGDSTVTTSFTTLPSGASPAFSFDVLGDWGTTSTSQTAGTFNVYQQHLDAQIRASTQGPDPALFAVSTGDIAYNDGSQTNYGDATGAHAADVLGTADTSDVFDPRYWGQVGSQLPLVTTTGNHGRNGTFLNVWPEPALTAPAAGYPAGRYALSPAGSYPPVDGYSQSSSTPDAWYAFTVGSARFYILDADWTDISPTTYPALGGGCVAQTGGSRCPTYQLERDEHWRSTSAEYQWLSADLAHDRSTRGAGALRFAFFHYPIHVDQNNWTTAADVYLQNSSQNPYGAAGSLEGLLDANGVRIAFNGHAHLYERNIAPVGGVLSYVTGGGGGVPTNVISSSKCSTTDAYARGWDMTHNVGSQCGAQSGGTALSQADNVYHFLKVRVSGSDVTVTPTDSLGNTFDVMTYHFGDVTPPAVPSGTPTAVLKAGTNQVTISSWGTSADTVDGTASAYDIYRDGGYAGTVTARRTSFVDAAPAGAHRWTVRARDLAGNQSADGPASNSVTVPDVTPPTAPTATATTGSAPGEIDLAWSGASDDVGVTSYAVFRDGAPTALAQVTGTAYADTSNDPGTTHSYTVVARDAAGNASPPSAAVTAVAGAAAAMPLSVSATQGATSGQVDVSWGPPSTDGGTSYAVSRNGTVVATGLTGTTYDDAGVADGVPVTYTVTATYASGARQSASYTFTPDWTPPTPPTLTATARSSSQVDLSWVGSTDNVTGYAVSYAAPGGASQQVPLSDPTATSVSVTGLQPGTAYSFTVTATDVGGNTSSSTATATTMVLSDGFESGSFGSPWLLPVTGNVAVQSAIVHSGGWAAREQSTGSPSSVTATLPASYRALHASAYVYITSHSTSASFFKLRGPGGEYIAYLYVNAANQLAVRNDAGLVTHPSSTVLANGRWYHVELWLDVDPGGPITIKAAVDGTPVTFTTPVGSTETLGSKLIGRITLGDDVSGRTYDVAIDDLTLDLGS